MFGGRASSVFAITGGAKIHGEYLRGRLRSLPQGYFLGSLSVAPSVAKTSRISFIPRTTQRETALALVTADKHGEAINQPQGDYEVDCR